MLHLWCWGVRWRSRILSPWCWRIQVFHSCMLKSFSYQMLHRAKEPWKLRSLWKYRWMKSRNGRNFNNVMWWNTSEIPWRHWRKWMRPKLEIFDEHFSQMWVNMKKFLLWSYICIQRVLIWTQHGESYWFHDSKNSLVVSRFFFAMLISRKAPNLAWRSWLSILCHFAWCISLENGAPVWIPCEVLRIGSSFLWSCFCWLSHSSRFGMCWIHYRSCWK